MVTSTHVERQSQLGLSQWFLGMTVSALPQAKQDEVLAGCQALGRRLSETFAVHVDVPAIAERPAERVGEEAIRLNSMLRESMYKCDLFIVLLYGPYSNGVAYELTIASEYAVPVILCTHSSMKSVPETYERGELRVLERFEFDDLDQAQSTLLAWLSEHQDDLRDIATRREAARAYVEQLRFGPVLEEACSEHAQLSLDEVGESRALSPFYFMGGIRGRGWNYASLTMMQLAMWTQETDLSMLELLLTTDGGIRPKFNMLMFEALMAEGLNATDIVGFVKAHDPRWKKEVESLPHDQAVDEIRERLRQFKRKQNGDSEANDVSRN